MEESERNDFVLYVEFDFSFGYQHLYGIGCKICSSRKKDTPWKDLKNEIGYFCFSLIVIWIINIYIGYIQ